jgi:hypothetical protein
MLWGFEFTDYPVMGENLKKSPLEILEKNLSCQGGTLGHI